MESNLDLNAWGAGGTERRSALATVAGLLVATIAIAPVAAWPLAPSFPLDGMLLAASCLCLTMTGVLLAFHARATSSLPTAVLAAGFFFAAATIVPLAITSPGMFGLPERPLLDATAASPGWLWCSWRAALLVSMLAFWYLRRPGASAPALDRPRRLAAAVAAAYAVITAFALWTPGLSAPGVTIVVVLAIAAVVAVLRRAERATVLDLCLGIVAFALLAEATLLLLGGHRWTAGWYASRVISLAAASVVLGVLLRRESEMYASLVRRAEVLEGEAHTDTLTGLPNRRRFDEEFARAFGNMQRRDSTLAIAMADIDHFKLFNDAFGHPAGDVALRTIAQAIAASVDRDRDIAARYGGEEFVVILEDTSLEGAIAVAERMRTAVLATGLRAPGGGLLSISVGVASSHPSETAGDVLRHADEALYAAKNAGRNRVVAWNAATTGVPVI